MKMSWYARYHSVRVAPKSTIPYHGKRGTDVIKLVLSSTTQIHSCYYRMPMCVIMIMGGKLLQAYKQYASEIVDILTRPKHNNGWDQKHRSAFVALDRSNKYSACLADKTEYRPYRYGRRYSQ